MSDRMFSVHLNDCCASRSVTRLFKHAYRSGNIGGNILAEIQAKGWNSTAYLRPLPVSLRGETQRILDRSQKSRENLKTGARKGLGVRVPHPPSSA
jgi:hypothetical protein